MNRPEWLSPSLFPFESKYFEVEEGAMHYVDEGIGEPVLLVHGTPTWSFLYRSVISELSDEYRMVAVDHLGFGLSDKPPDASYRPEDHARRLARFVEHLGLDQFTLAVHDFGGPIGLPYAIQHPEAVSRVVLFNTWLWSLKGNRTLRFIDPVVRGPIGRLFYRRYNGSPKVILKSAWGKENRLTDEVHSHYTSPFPSRQERTAPWTLARELVGSTEWYESWWEQREQFTAKPTLVVWGLKDPTFGEDSLERWTRNLTDATVTGLPDTGHFVPDEAGERVSEELGVFLADT